MARAERDERRGLGFTGQIAYPCLGSVPVAFCN